MRLVPRQLARSGMTGDVPYYGGRLTPAQAYGAQHGRTPAGAPGSPPAAAATPTLTEQLAMLEELRAAGTVTEDEYAALRSRVLA